MISIKTDTHVHSIYTNHAYSTIEENARYASSIGMEGIAITDHFGPMCVNDILEAMFQICNRTILPSHISGVRVLRGIEIDIVDHEGNLAYYNVESPIGDGRSIPERVLKTCELAIASVHRWKDFQATTKLEHTKMYINALRNPYIDIIGHSGRSGMEYEIDEVLKVAKEEGKLIEINNHSFDKGDCSICKKIAERCAELDVNITVSSDAHFSSYIGNYDRAIAMLEEIHFPEHLIANASLEKLLSHIRTDKKNIVM